MRCDSKSAGSHPRLPPCCGALLCLVVLSVPAPVRAASLADLSLEQLSEVVVSSVSRRDERLDRSASSVHVITSEDIRRSGATTLAEALRLAPQLHVARADANQYAISARGFNNVLANKMLVLIDGRTLYSPLFSGVFWQSQDTMLEDIDRIEVVSGPSAALWGTNAVNGLIHIITRQAARTQDAAGFAEIGNRQRVAALRFGAKVGEHTHYRLYAKGHQRKRSELASTGAAVDDAAGGAQAGLRVDLEMGHQALRLWADIYRSDIGEQGRVRRADGAHMTLRWRRDFPGGARLIVRGLYEQTQLRRPDFQEKLDTVDLLSQYDVATAPNNRLIVGAGHRSARDNTSNGPSLAFLPAHRTLSWSRVFAQNQFDFTQQVSLALAASLERNPYTGVEFLPSARLSWRVAPGHFTWASASRAVRAPSRIDRELYLPASPPHTLAGGPAFESEVANVVELGYRSQPTVAISYALTAFRHDFKRLRSLQPTPQGSQFANGLAGRTQGLEASVSWRVDERWRLVAGGTALSRKIRLEPGATDAGGEAALGNDPSHWWSLRSTLDVTPRLVWDVSVRGSGSLPAPAVPSYADVDMRLAWSLRPDVEIALSVRNLTDDRHPEWGVATNRIEFGRSTALQLRWRL